MLEILHAITSLNPTEYFPLCLTAFLGFTIRSFWNYLDRQQKHTEKLMDQYQNQILNIANKYQTFTEGLTDRQIDQSKELVKTLNTLVNKIDTMLSHVLK